MRTRTFLALQSEAMALADCGHDTHITEADDGAGGTINLAALWVNQGIADLWRKLVRASPDRYVVSATLNTTAGTFAYDLEEDFLAIRRVDLMRGAQRLPVEPFEFQSAPYYVPDTTIGVSAGIRTRYRVVGQGVDGSTTQIHFDPDPGTNTYTIWYVTTPPVLAADDDVFDGVAGYEDYIVAYAAFRMMVRQDNTETAAFVLAEQNRIESPIVASAANRDVGRAPRIADVRPRGFR